MVFETVRRARRRILANEALSHAAYAASGAFFSLVLLLLLGTQILNWGWLFLLPAATLAAGAYATWRRAPSLYQAAQRVDRNLNLADTLSTALFFFTRGEAAHGLQDAQWEQAERMAANVNPRTAIPLRWPRAMYGTALAALVAVSLFALRYGLERRLDLRAPLLRIVQDELGYPQLRQAAREHPEAARRNTMPSGETGLSPGAAQKDPGELDAAPDSALDTVGVPDAENKTGSSRAEASKLAKSNQLEAGQNEGSEPEGISTNEGNNQPGDGKQGPGAGKQGQGGEKEASGNSGENSGLLGKFKDAMSSLLKRMGQQSGAKGGQQQAGAQSGQQKSGQGNAGQSGKQGQQPGDGERADAKDGQPGDDSQNAQSGQSGSPGESGQQPATKQPGSGIGRQDGSKDVKLAEQLAAMGKISEIIGKRAANVTGEVTVEVQNNNQQLRTPYARAAAHHTEAGGEINRDEIPVALQAYVQQYFEQVRKQAPPPGSTVHGRRRPEPAKPGL